MSNRKMRHYVKGLSLHELRRMALGEDLTRFVEEQGPEIRALYTQLLEQTKTLVAENSADLLRLQTMHCDSPTLEEQRKEEISRTYQQLQNYLATAHSLQSLIERMSAGGLGSVWSVIQKGLSKKAEQDSGNQERAAKPARRFQLKAAEQSAAQPVDAEVIEAETE